mgnify:CR=1 FL=1
MAKIDLEYAQMLSEIVLNGKIFVNEDGVVRRQIPYYTFRHEMCNGFPAVTLKKVDVQNVIQTTIEFLQHNKKKIAEAVSLINKTNLDNIGANLCPMIIDCKDNGELCYEYHFNSSLICGRIYDTLFFCGLYALIFESLIGVKASAIQIDLKAPCVLEDEIEETREILTKNPMLNDACQISCPIYLTSENESVEWKLDRLKVEDFTITNYPNFNN